MFASKTASSHPEGRAGYIDGYAGRGTYRNGADGSPKIALEIAAALQRHRPPKTLDCWFVEPNSRWFETLRVLAGERAMPGTIEKNLERLLNGASDAPLFAFLDPFGMGLPISTLLGILDRPQPGRLWPTEVLLNFSIETLRRQAGMVATDNVAAGGTRAAIDHNLGGSYWRDWLRPGDLESEQRVLAEYCRRIQQASGNRYVTWSMPVSDRWQGRAIYHLILVTAHPQGEWEFADALARAVPEYYESVALSLFDPDHLAREGKAAMARNVSRLVEQHGSIVLGDRTRELYAEAVGKAGKRQLRQALHYLYEEGVIAEKPTGDLRTLRVSKGPGPRPRVPQEQTLF